jgi:hypothetical protein
LAEIPCSIVLHQSVTFSEEIKLKSLGPPVACAHESRVHYFRAAYCIRVAWERGAEGEAPEGWSFSRLAEKWRARGRARSFRALMDESRDVDAGRKFTTK